MLGNKGGVGVALTYMNHTRLLFVNAHFAAHDHKVAQRQADYLRIKAGLFNTKDEPGGLLQLMFAWSALLSPACLLGILPLCGSSPFAAELACWTQQLLCPVQLLHSAATLQAVGAADQLHSEAIAQPSLLYHLDF